MGDAKTGTVVPPGYVLTNWDPNAGRWYPCPGARWGAAVPPGFWREYQAALDRLDELNDRTTALSPVRADDD